MKHQMSKGIKIVLLSVVFAIIINVVVPLIFKMVATKNQINPPNGADKLPVWDQIMHMFVHHAQVPVSSSLIIAVIVSISVGLSVLILKL